MVSLGELLLCVECSFLARGFSGRTSPLCVVLFSFGLAPSPAAFAFSGLAVELQTLGEERGPPVPRWYTPSGVPDVVTQAEGGQCVCCEHQLSC